MFARLERPVERSPCCVSTRRDPLLAAQGTSYWPADPYLRAQVLEWMFFEQSSHGPYVAMVRFRTFAGQLDAHAAELPERRRRGVQAWLARATAQPRTVAITDAAP